MVLPLPRHQQQEQELQQYGDCNAKFTVDEALVALGFGKFQGLMLAYAGMGWIAEAMEMMLLSFVGPAVQAVWGLSSHQESLITSVVFAGMLVGAYSWGIVSDNLGRSVSKLYMVWTVFGFFCFLEQTCRFRLPNHTSCKALHKSLNGFYITAMVTCVAGLLSAFAPNYPTLIILRCLVGLGLGGGPVLSSWVLEFIPAPERGTWMVVFSAFWTVGTVMEASLAWLVMPTFGWRWLLALSALPSFVLLLFYSYVPESPRFLHSKGRTIEALGVLEKVARLNQRELPSGMLVLEHKLELADNYTSEDAHLLSPAPERNDAKVMDSKNESASALFMLLSPKLIRSTLLLWLVFIGAAFSYYGIVLLTTELTSQKSQCTPTALPVENSLPTSAYKDVFIASFAEFPGHLIAAVIVDRLGRKLSMTAMFFTCCFFLLPLVHQPSESLTTALLFGARICITGPLTILYVYAPEVYPTSVRTTGVGVASAMGRIGGMICPLVAVGLVHGCHQTASILLFVFIMSLSGMVVLFFPFETKGCELSDNVSKFKESNSVV